MVSVITAGHLLSPSPAVAGPWSVQASLGVAGELNDNVGLTVDNKEADLSTTLSPSIQVTRTGERITLSSRYRSGIGFFAKRPDLNNISHIGRIDGLVHGLGLGILQEALFEFSGTLTVTESLADSSFEDEPVPNEGVVTGRSGTLNYGLNTTLTLPFTDRTTSIAGFSRTTTKFDDPTLVDRIVHAASIGLAREMTDRVTANAIYVFRHQQLNEQDRATHEFTAGAVVRVNPTVTVSGRGGFAYFPGGGATRAIGEAAVTKLFEYTRAKLDYRSRVGSGGALFDDATLNQTVKLELTRLLGTTRTTMEEREIRHITRRTRRSDVSLFASYSDQRDFSGIAQTLRLVRVGARLRYPLTQWLHLTAAYQHLQQRRATTLRRNTVTLNTVTLMLRGTWGAPIL